MRKGVSAVEVVFIIIIAVAIFYIFSARIVPQTTKPSYNNNLITIEKYRAQDEPLFASTETSIDFDLRNNGDRILDVEVNFFDVPGFTVKQLVCTGARVEGNKCLLYGINPLTTRKVGIDLIAPRDVQTEVPLPVSFYVKYKASGYRRAVIPVIDSRILDEPENRFTQSNPSYGPVVLEFKLITGDYEIKNRVFGLKIKLSHVGSVAIAKPDPVVIPAGGIRLNLIGLEKVPGIKCDFADNLKSKEATEVPDELICYFKSVDFSSPELDAVVEASFGYEYKMTKAQTFEVKPLG